MVDSGDRERARGRNLAGHLNDRHPDTVLFLARQAAGRGDAVAAELTGLDEDGMTLSVTSGGGTEVVQVALPADSGVDLRGRFGALLRRTRAGAPDAPLTSLERQHAE